MANYDVIVIGAGPGGYVCAIRCAQLGLKTACIEQRKTLGGTCLNIGCIPSKALLHASHMYHEAKHNFKRMGLMTNSVAVDFAKMQAYKKSIVSQNIKGIEFLFKKNKVDWLQGQARLGSNNQVKVGTDNYQAKAIVIATGSEVAPLNGVDIDEKIILSSTGALALNKIPKKMLVIGAGVIGLEMGSIYARLGSKVTVIEYLNHITPDMDADVAKILQRILKRQGMKFILGAAVQSATVEKFRATVHYTLRKNNKHSKLDADVILLATGRRAFTDGLGFKTLGGQLTKQGQIKIDAHWRTNVAGVYAIGDVVPGAMLAHKAEDEAMAVAEVIAGRHGHVNYQVIPAVIYTTPEVAAVGKTEQELKQQGINYKVGQFSFMGNARAKTVFQSGGFVKLLAHSKTDRILGCHMISPMAGDIIHEVCVAMEFGAAAEDLALTCHAHPTFSEAIREAALACGDGAIHA